jgi:GR25 family glycosyltransferase involved in LPS biosynthesis
MVHKNRFFVMVLAFFACCVFGAHIEASIGDHLKKALNKSDVHQMKNIDFIYMINLDQRPEKFAKCTQQLHPYGIYPYRFSAVNGWELSLETINDVGVKFAPGMTGGFLATSFLPQDNFQSHHEEIQNYGQTYFCHCTARGTIGIALSHLSVLQDALDSGYETIWVMEDDIEVIQDPRQLSNLIEKLDKVVGKSNWDILFTDQDIRDANGNYIPCYGYARRPNFHPKNPMQYHVREDLDEDFRRIGARFGAHSMIVRRSGMKKILKFIKSHQMFLPYDMDFYLPIGIRMYSVINDVVSNQPRAISDNGGPNYLK